MNIKRKTYDEIEAEIPKASELEQIPIEENGEPMVDMKPEDGLILSFHNSGEMLELFGERMICRAKVEEMLLEANLAMQRISDNLRLKIFYAYRALSIQDKYYANAIKHAREQSPDRSEEWQMDFAHTRAAKPSVAGHATGGAIDLTIFDLEQGEDVDMGVPVYRAAINEAGRKIYTESPEIGEEFLSNRLLLREVMASVGFAPFSGEFWHFSYGDREWAAKLGKKKAFYDQLRLER